MGGRSPSQRWSWCYKTSCNCTYTITKFLFFFPTGLHSQDISHNVLLLPDCYTHFLLANLPVNFTSKYYWTKCWKTSNQQKWISYHSTSISIGSMFIRYGTCSANKHLNWKKKHDILKYTIISLFPDIVSNLRYRSKPYFDSHLPAMLYQISLSTHTLHLPINQAYYPSL